MADSDDVMSQEDYLAHYGVLGMKWGVRKDDRLGPGGPQNEKPKKLKREKPPLEVAYKQKLKNGGELIVYKDPPIKTIGELLRLPTAKVTTKTDFEYNFTLKNEKDEKVGEASFATRGPKELNLEWIGVRGKHRGNGYATAVMKGMVNYAKDQGIERLTLEVPGDSPDARHIYEKYGFREIEGDSHIESDAWGGLTFMELKLKNKQLTHAANGTLIDYIVKELDAMPAEPTEEELGDELMHYGVLGMKWGRRKDRGTSAVTPSADSTKVRELRKKNVKELSNQELRDLTQRQQLEQQYAKLNPKTTERGKNAVKAGIAFGATGVAVYNMYHSPAGIAARKAGKEAYSKLIKKF